MKPCAAALIVSGFVATLTVASSAWACSAPRPSAGAIVSGPVLAVPASHTICVATGPAPSQWVALRVDPPGSDTSVSIMMAAVFAKRVSCVVGPDGAARCVVGKEDINQLLRRPALRTVAQAWR